MRRFVVLLFGLGLMLALFAAPTAARSPIWGFPGSGYSSPPGRHYPTPPVQHTPVSTPIPVVPQPQNPLNCAHGFVTQYGNSTIDATEGDVHVVFNSVNTGYDANISYSGGSFTASNTSLTFYYSQGGCGDVILTMSGSNSDGVTFSLRAESNNGTLTIQSTAKQGSTTLYSVSGAIDSGSISIVPLTYNQ